MEVRELLGEAQAAVDESGIANDLRTVAFSKAIDLLVRESFAGASEAPPDVGGGGDPLRLISQRLDIDLEVAQAVYSVKDGDLEIVVGTRLLAPRAAAATKELALLVAGGRQAGGFDDEWTDVGHIRRWAETYKRLDSPNFSSAIKEMEHLFSVRGTPRKREVRMTMPAWDETSRLVRRLGGADGGGGRR
jgi:hypothetical protein